MTVFISWKEESFTSLVTMRWRSQKSYDSRVQRRRKNEKTQQMVVLDVSSYIDT